jgi:hypothetical protein
MHVHDALERLDQIHDQLTRSEVYRGFRVQAVAATGLVAVVAALVQPMIPGAAEGLGFAWFWLAVAGAGGFLGTAAAVHDYLTREDTFARRRTRRVMAQFAPCLLAGGAITLGVMRLPELVAFLPGLWAIVFGLGIIAARPHLPHGIGFVGLGYILAGSALFFRAQPGAESSEWSVGGVFGVGHLATAFVLWRSEPRSEEASNG